MFTTHILVRFGDLDAAGIAYYPNLVNFVHVAFEDFFSGHVGRPYPEVYADGIGFPTVKVEVEFLSPVHFGDNVRIDVTVERVGNSSVQIRYEASIDDRPVFRQFFCPGCGTLIENEIARADDAVLRDIELDMR